VEGAVVQHRAAAQGPRTGPAQGSKHGQDRGDSSLDDGQTTSAHDESRCGDENHHGDDESHCGDRYGDESRYGENHHGGETQSENGYGYERSENGCGCCHGCECDDRGFQNDDDLLATCQVSRSAKRNDDVHPQ